MTLREEFENEIKTNKGGISILFETSNQHYIEWLESKVKSDEEIPKTSPLKYKTMKFVEMGEWDRLVQDTYKKPYSIQQQDGCRSRGIYKLDVPSKWTDSEDAEMYDSIPEKINGDEYGVKFAVWLADSKAPVENRTDYYIDLFWERNFYPNTEVLANDLYKKGLLEKGQYVININW